MLRIAVAGGLFAAVTPLLAPVALGGRKSRAVTLGVSEAATLRALIVCNLIFAGQTAMDFAYLGAGAALPEGLSYAAYAHRGAYPLVIAALLAGAFVLLAFPDGRGLSLWTRRLTYLWIGQTIALTGAAMFRTWLYVEAYGLTELRVAAQIWMGVVAAGLGLILYRLATGRSAQWLIEANGLMLGTVLYLCCFLNFTALISHYNVQTFLSSDREAPP